MEFQQDNNKMSPCQQGDDGFWKLLTSKNIELFNHTPNSPDLTPVDFWLFPQLKSQLAGMKADTENEVKTAVQGFGADIMKERVYSPMAKWHKRMAKWHKRMAKWHKRMAKYVDVHSN